MLSLAPPADGEMGQAEGVFTGHVPRGESVSSKIKNSTRLLAASWGAFEARAGEAPVVRSQ
jgi:hypothetical protein